jgi:prevent-host-death family protein
MGRQVNLCEAKTQLSRLVDEAANGDVIIIAKDGKPMAKLGPISASDRKQPRRLGQLAEHAKGVTAKTSHRLRDPYHFNIGHCNQSCIHHFF